MKQTMIYVLLAFGICSLMLPGCQEDVQQKQKEESAITPTQSEESAVQDQTLPVYLADLMAARQFRITDEYQEMLKQQLGFLRYEKVVDYNKSRCIFHHAITDIENTITFPDIPITAHTKLKFSIGLFIKNRKISSDGVRFKIFVQHEDLSTELFDATLHPDEFDRWQDYAIPLSAYAGETITVQLQTKPAGHMNQDWAVWGDPRLTNYAITRDSDIKRLSSARWYEAIFSEYQGLQLPGIGNTIDRGWFTAATTTDIILGPVETHTVVRSEVCVIDYSGKPSEEIVVEFLDAHDRVMLSSPFSITSESQVISTEYRIDDQHPEPPAKLRIQLQQDKPSILFIKEPILYRVRQAHEEPDVPNVILISLDTLRADRLDEYGYHRETSPNLARLADEGFVFTNAYSNALWTLPSHTSMFTSLYPIEHQRNSELAYGLPYFSMTEAFQASQYLTIAFTGGGFVHARYGFNKGFGYHFETPGFDQVTETPIQTLAAFLEHHREIPIFLFLHTYEVHEYNKERLAHQKFVQSDFQRQTISDFGDVLPLGKILKLQAAAQAKFQPEVLDTFDKIRLNFLSEAGIGYVNDLYDGAIVYTDDLLGTFFQELRNIGLYDTSWIVVTSDHGEGLGEKHYDDRYHSWVHTDIAYEERVHIPLIMKPPKGWRQGTNSNGIIDQPVQTIDLPPTLLAILGLPPNEQFHGRNLLPLMENPTDFMTEGDAIFSDFLRWGRFAVLSQGYKLIACYDTTFMDEKVGYELYNLRDDPQENVNLVRSPKEAPIFNELRQLLDEHLEEFLSARGTVSQGTSKRTQKIEEKDIDPKHLEQLKDLGYL